MKKTPTSQPSAAKAFAHPEAIIDRIEQESPGVPPEDLYRARIETLMATELDKRTYNGSFDVDVVDDVKHIRETQAGGALEEAARHTGFVLGFEYCRDLIVSGAAKGGAR